MARISNLCNLILISTLLTFCAPAHAEQLPPNFNIKHIRILCSSMSSFLDYTKKENFKLIFLGDTVSQGIQEMVWVRENNTEFVVMRYIESTQEACMLSSGAPQFIEN